MTKSSPSVGSKAPLSKTLGLKTGHTMVLIDAPAGFQDQLEMPKGIDVHTAARRGVEFDVAMLFVPTSKMLSARLGPLSPLAEPAGCQALGVGARFFQGRVDPPAAQSTSE